jgi:hypothetical protein
MDPRAEALYLESNEYVGGDHPLTRITRPEAEAAVLGLDTSMPGWDAALFLQVHPAAPEFGESGLGVNPQVLLDVFAPALITLYPNRSSDRAVSEAAGLRQPPMRPQQVAPRPEVTTTKPRHVFDVVCSAMRRWMGR